MVWVNWFLKRSALILAVCVLSGFILGWFLPTTQDWVLALGFAQIVMAIIVLIRESVKLSKEYLPKNPA
jgi:hypothetical protein